VLKQIRFLVGVAQDLDPLSYYRQLALLSGVVRIGGIQPGRSRSSYNSGLSSLSGESATAAHHLLYVHL